MSNSRYRRTAVMTQKGNTYYGVPEATVYPLSATDVFYTVQSEDTLHKIAYRLLGSAELWWVIAYFNDVTDPFQDLVVGSTLRVPNKSRLWMEVLA